MLRLPRSFRSPISKPAFAPHFSRSPKRSHWAALCLVLATILCSGWNPAAAQSGVWTWMGGSSKVPGADEGQPGVYGTLGTPAAKNIPGGRAASAVWTDLSGNTWLLGGYGVDANGAASYLNDLWKLNPATNQWTWMSGSSTIGASEGQPGVSTLR